MADVESSAEDVLRAEKRAYMAAWRARNREHLRVSRAAYYAANAERENRQNAEWRASNLERHLRTRAEYRASNGDAIAAYDKAYRAANYDKHLARNSKRRAKKFGNGGAHTPEQVQELLVRQRFRCAYCRTSIKKRPIKDHILAISKGGTDDISNIQMTCYPCNAKKGAKHPLEFARLAGLLL